MKCLWRSDLGTPLFDAMSLPMASDDYEENSEIVQGTLQTR
jgi:hypothetical protein